MEPDGHLWGNSSTPGEQQVGHEGNDPQMSVTHERKTITTWEAVIDWVNVYTLKHNPDKLSIINELQATACITCNRSS